MKALLTIAVGFLLLAPASVIYGGWMFAPVAVGFSGGAYLLFDEARSVKRGTR